MADSKTGRTIPDLISEHPILSIGIAIIIVLLFFYLSTHGWKFSKDGIIPPDEAYVKHDTIRVIHDTVYMPSKNEAEAKKTTAPPKEPPTQKASSNKGNNSGHVGDNSNSGNNSGQVGDNTNAGNNLGNIGGQGNSSDPHIVNGTNNGVNGDVNINQEKRLSQAEKNYLSNYVSDGRIRNKITSDTAVIYLEMTSNGGRFADDLENYLMSDLHFKYVDRATVASYPNIKKAVVLTVKGQLSIKVGFF